MTPLLVQRHGVVPRWVACPQCPCPLWDAAGVRVGRRLYVIGGYQDLNTVNGKVFVFDLDRERWVDAIESPARLAHSHVAVCADDRFIYAVSGQLGPQCSPAITDSFAFDTLKKIWRELPGLPAPRYAGTMQLLGNRLHFVGGAKEDRYTPAADHWSLAVEGGRAIESEWREEARIPRPGMHRGSTTIGRSFYVFGGQEGDFIPIKGDPNYACTGRTPETYIPDTYRFDSDKKQWVRLRDMPVPASHTDFSVVVDGNLVHVIGGQIYKHPEHFTLRLTDQIQTYDINEDRWSISGYYPYRAKVQVCAIHRKQVYCTTGQRDTGNASDAPGPIVADTWCAAIREFHTAAKADLLPMLDGKTVALISHELSWTGAPLILLEVARAMQESGACVRLFTLADDAVYGNPAERYRIPVLPIETAGEWAASSDLIIANTMVAGPWIRDFLAEHPESAKRLIWWNHENSAETYGHLLEGTTAVTNMLFDSHSSRAIWEAAGLPLPANRWVVHPGNREELLQVRTRLPWLRSERLQRAMARKRLGVGKNDFLLLCVGTIDPVKGQTLLIEAIGTLLEQHPELPLRLLIVGVADELQRSALLATLSPAESRVMLGGRLLCLQQPELGMFYRAADAFVMNSQRNGENFGRVTIEAMAFGLPVLGTNAGGTAEIVIDGETGLLHPVGQAGSEVLAANVLRLINDRRYAKRLGAAGRRRASDYFSARRFYRELGEALARDASTRYR